MLTQYSPASVLVSIKGFPIIHFAKGTFIKHTYNVDQSTLTMGSDGHGVRTITADLSGTIEIVLLQGSPSNDYLATLAAIDRNPLTLGAGQGSFLMTDLFNVTKVSAAQCWVKKVADVERGDEAASVTWMLESDRLLIKPGSGFVTG